MTAMIGRGLIVFKTALWKKAKQEYPTKLSAHFIIWEKNQSKERY